MATNNQVQTTSSLAEQAAKIDQISNGALEVVTQASSGDGNAFTTAIQMAKAMNDLREAITPEMMKEFMKLMNTPLGFKTDKDPTVWSAKANDGKGGYQTPYPESVVKECVIQATLRGVRVCANMFNIIAGQTYITKEGYKYLLKKIKGFTDFRVTLGTPNIQDGQAKVRCSAHWKINGVPSSIGADPNEPCVIALNVNNFMGPDSVLGKCERKLYKRIYEQITGCETPDGDVDTDVSQGSLPQQPKRPVLAKDNPPIETKAEVKEVPPIDQLKELIRNEDGVTFDMVLGHLKTVRIAGPLTAELEQLSDEKLMQAVKRWPELLPAIKKLAV